MYRFIVSSKWNVLLVLAVAILSQGCHDRDTVTLVPILPADERQLLRDSGVTILEIRAESLEDPHQRRVVRLERGDDLVLDDIEPGAWIVQARGLDAEGNEVLYGKTLPFEVGGETSVTVNFFLGHSFAFNELGLEPPETAALLTNLVGHTVTQFVNDQGNPQILVAGGTHISDNKSPAQLLLIDASEYTIEALPPLPCAWKQHHALAVETDLGVRIVLAGGLGECTGGETGTDKSNSSNVVVVDPQTGQHSRIALEQCPFVDAAMSAEVRADINGTYRHTGYIVVPGAGGCLFDPLGPKTQQGIQRTTFSQGNVVKGATGSLGYMATMNRQGVLAIEDIEEVSENSTVCPDPERRFWPGLSENGQARLFPIQNGEYFLWLGPGQETDDSNWSLIRADPCGIKSVYEGTEELLADIVDFSPIEQRMGQRLTVLLTGGQKAGMKTNDVLMLQQGNSSSRYSWHKVSDGSLAKPLAMKHPRAAHKTIAHLDGTHWIIGGGDSPIEVFVPGTQGIEILERPFIPRNPSLFAMTVMDASLSVKTATRFIAEKVLTQMLSYESPTTVLLYGDADRGIDDNVVDPDNFSKFCKFNATNTPSSVSRVTVKQDKVRAESEALEIINVLTQGSQPTDGNVRIFYNNTSSWKSTRDLWNSASLPKPHPLSSDTETERCPWKQYFRVGFDGLTHEQKDHTYAGINLLAIIAGDDDCSQGLFTRGAKIPNENHLKQNGCTDSVFDDYFGLPPDTTEREEELGNIVSRLSWDAGDLIVVPIAVRNTSPTNDDPVVARRVMGTADYLADKYGTQMVPIEIEKNSEEENFSLEADRTLDAGLSKLHDLINSRNFMQACLPDNYGPQDAIFFEDVGPDGLFAPYRNNMNIQPVMEHIDRQCSIVSSKIVVSNDRDEGDYVKRRKFRRLDVRTESMIGTDSDRRAGCETGWLLRLLSKAGQGSLVHAHGAAESDSYLTCLK